MARLSQGQTIAAVGAVALLIAMFLAWAGNGSSVNVWKLPGSDLDIYLLITAAALLLAVLALTGNEDEFSFVSAATFLLGLAGAILVISWLTFDFPDGAERKIGAYIGLGAVIVIAIGGFRAMQEEVAGEI